MWLLGSASRSDIIPASRAILPLRNVISFAAGSYCRWSRNPSDHFRESTAVGSSPQKSQATSCQKNSNLSNVGVMLDSDKKVTVTPMSSIRQV